MEAIPYKGRRWMWANNRVGEGFIEERFDLFFGSAEWLVENEKAEVEHLVKHSSDHSMLLLNTLPDQAKRKTRFIYDHRWCKQPGCLEVVHDSWKINVVGSQIYQFNRKLKNVRSELLE